MDRSKLPYRRNCEGYLICKDGTIIVRDSGRGYLEFPGGGVDETETPGEALIREALEEAGVIIDGQLNEIKVINFDWGPAWAKTDKQRARYSKFRGEEMHLFIGKVLKLVAPKGDSKEHGWPKERTMKVSEAISKNNSFKPFP